MFARFRKLFGKVPSYLQDKFKSEEVPAGLHRVIEKCLVSIVGLGKHLYLVDFEEIKNVKKSLRDFANFSERFPLIVKKGLRAKQYQQGYTK